MLNSIAGNYGDAAVAAMTIVSRFTMFINSVIIGFGQGFQPVCAFNFGARKYDRVKRSFWFCVKVATIAIYDRYDGFGKLKGMQVSGRAEIVEPFSAEYIHAAEWKKIPVDALKKLSFTMNLIKITPTEIEFLNSDFKEDGYDSRQRYDCGREES